MEMNEKTCSAQRYWYENGTQRGKFCGEPAIYEVQGLDRRTWFACAKDAALAATVGAQIKKMSSVGTLTQVSAPRGMVATFGHPGNGHLIVKYAESGESGWRSVDTGELIPDEAFRSGWLPYLLDVETFEPIPYKESDERVERIQTR